MGLVWYNQLVILLRYLNNECCNIMMRSQPALQKKHIVSTFVPSPQNKDLILNYFKYNNFQDFNTWQQIAKTKLQCEFQQHSNHFQCNITLQWDDRRTPLIHAKAQAHTKKSAKRRGLAMLIQQLICKALISRGFREDNFVQQLPRRRRNYSDQSSDEEPLQIQNPQSQALLGSFLKQQDYQSCIQTLIHSNSQATLLAIWTHALNMNSVKLGGRILSAISNLEVGELEEQVLKWEKVTDKSRQFLNGSEVKFALQEDLTDFMPYFQLSKEWEERKFEVAALRKRVLPSQFVLSKGTWLQGSKLMQEFHPIELSKLLCDRKRLQKADNSLLQLQQIEIPQFEHQGLVLTLPILQRIHSLLLFQAHNFPFCLHMLSLMQRHLPLATIRLGSSFSEPNSNAEEYYLKHKNDLTAEFIELLWSRINNRQQAIKIQGMLQKKPDENHYHFFPKEGEEFVNIKINKKTNTNQFDQMRQISLREMVFLQSKFVGSWIAQIVELSSSPSIRMFIPGLTELQQSHPVTLYRLCNAKLFEKTSAALAQTSESCLNLIQQNTHLIRQPPTFPSVPVICELLLQWQASKQSVLIVSPNSVPLHQNLQALGFKTTLLSIATDEKTLLKSSTVVASPSAVCCDLLRNYAFSRVLVDEAHALSEVSILSAAVKGCKHLWLVGDPYLPRMSVYSKQGKRRGMNRSLFERLFKEGKECLTFTSETQEVRYFQNVLGWLNKKLYRGELRVLGEEKQLPVIKGFLWPSSTFRICILHLPQTASLSEYLHKQAEVVATICNNILRTGYTVCQQISCLVSSPHLLPLLTTKLAQIIPPYLQKKNLQAILSSMAGVVTGSRYNVREVSIMMAGAGQQIGDLCSLVGWLVQGRRGGIMVADVHTLAKQKDWAPFLAWCNSNKLICKLQQ